MKILKYLPYIILGCMFIRCTSEGDIHTKIFRTYDSSDFHVYAGSADGGKEITFESDSLREATLTRLLGNINNIPDLYKDDTFEFFANKITYVYYDAKNQTIMKILSDYKFRNDTLFVYRSDASPIAAALGSAERLYQTRGLTCYPVKDKEQREIHIKDKSTFAIDSVLHYAGYNGVMEMKPGDTIAWCNIKYIYE